jgi:hypothetical protein
MNLDEIWYRGDGIEYVYVYMYVNMNMYIYVYRYVRKKILKTGIDI